MVEVRKPVDSDDLAPPAPLQLEIAPSLASLLGDEVETRSRVAGLAQGMREEYGVPIPVPQVRVSSALGEGEYRLTAHGARIASGRMRGDAHFLPARAGTEAAPKLPGFFPALNGEWTDAAHENTPRPPDQRTAHPRKTLPRRMGGFIGIPETSNLFGKMQDLTSTRLNSSH